MSGSRINLGKLLLVFTLVLCVSAGEVRAGQPSDSSEKLGLYVSPRCKRTLRGIGYSALTLVVGFNVYQFAQNQRAKKAVDNYAAKAPEVPMPQPPPLSASSTNFKGIRLPSTKDLEDQVLKENMKRINQYLEQNPIRITIPLDLKAAKLQITLPENDDRANTISILKSALGGIPGQPIPVPNGRLLTLFPAEMPTIYFHTGWELPSTALRKSAYHLRTDSRNEFLDLQQMGVTGLDRPIIADIVALSKSLLALHPVSLERNKNDKTPLSKRPEEYAQFLTCLRDERGETYKYWKDVLKRELSNDKSLPPMSHILFGTLDAFSGENQNDLDAKVRIFGELLIKKSETLRMVLFRLREHAAKIAMETPELSEDREILQDLLTPLGTDHDDYIREMNRGQAVVSVLQERQYARYILETCELARRKRRDVHVYLSVLETIRLARFINECYVEAGLKVNVYILPAGFQIGYEIPEGDYTNARLLELAKPFIPPENVLKKLEEQK